jgi:hypothetical protein
MTLGQSFAHILSSSSEFLVVQVQSAAIAALSRLITLLVIEAVFVALATEFLLATFGCVISS